MPEAPDLCQCISCPAIHCFVLLLQHFACCPRRYASSEVLPQLTAAPRHPSKLSSVTCHRSESPSLLLLGLISSNPCVEREKDFDLRFIPQSCLKKFQYNQQPSVIPLVNTVHLYLIQPHYKANWLVKASDVP